MSVAVLEIPVHVRTPVPGDGLACLGPIATPEGERWGLTLWADGRLLEVRAVGGQAFAVDTAAVAEALARAAAAHLAWAEAAQAGARGLVGRP